MSPSPLFNGPTNSLTEQMAQSGAGIDVMRGMAKETVQRQIKLPVAGGTVAPSARPDLQKPAIENMGLGSWADRACPGGGRWEGG